MLKLNKIGFNYFDNKDLKFNSTHSNLEMINVKC